MTAAMSDPRRDERARRNLILALVHVAIAVGILIAFVYVQSIK